MLNNTSQYRKLGNELLNLSDRELKPVLKELLLTDLYFLLWYGLNRPDTEHDWIIERCREVQNSPDGHLDLWAREHYKSTIITFAKTIQDVLNNPEITVGIFSHVRPIAKGFLSQIKREFEQNKLLLDLFSDILWADPNKEAPAWSLDTGLILKRKNNPKEPSIYAGGIVEGQPTGMHFSLMVYDDVVTIANVNSPDMMRKTLEALEVSYNLGAHGGSRRFIGTRYHANDAYKTIIDRGTVEPRIYPATEDGSMEGKPVFLSPEKLAEKRRDMGPYTFACQMLQDPVADKAQGFKREWIQRFSNRDHTGMNVYILVDPANEKKRSSDYTAMVVIGLSSDRNYYLLDLIYDRLNLTERADRLFELHRTYRPLLIGYERYGMQADIDHIQYRQDLLNYRFPIEEVGGSQPKNDRIRRLIPIFEQGHFWIPDSIFKTNYEGHLIDVLGQLVNEEYEPFPVGLHDDGLDAIARIFDIDTIWPQAPVERYGRKDRKSGTVWAG